MTMKLEFQTAGVVLPASKAQMNRWLNAALLANLAQAKRPTATKIKVSKAKSPSQNSGQITVRFVGAREGKQLNTDFRQKNYATNVLTFAYTQNPLFADLVLCMPVVRKEAREQGKQLSDHLAHLLIHGLLHALGMDHEQDKEAAVMEALETKILHSLGIQNPYET